MELAGQVRLADKLYLQVYWEILCQGNKGEGDGEDAQSSPLAFVCVLTYMCTHIYHPPKNVCTEIMEPLQKHF